MENTVKQRLIEFIKFNNLSQAKFEKAIGASNGFVNNISKGIGAEKMLSILNVFPTLNSVWLLTGEGEMLKSDTEKPTTEVLHLKELVKTQAETIASQKLLIETLLEKIERLQRAVEGKEAK